jgi:hypothetical protein
VSYTLSEAEHSTACREERAHQRHQGRVRDVARRDSGAAPASPTHGICRGEVVDDYNAPSMSAGRPRGQRGRLQVYVAITLTLDRRLAGLGSRRAWSARKRGPATGAVRLHPSRRAQPVFLNHRHARNIGPPACTGAGAGTGAARARPLGRPVGMDADALVGRCNRHFGQFATRGMRASALLLRSASWRVSPSSSPSRASMSRSRQAENPAVPDCSGSRAIAHKIPRTSSGLCFMVKQTSGGGRVAFFVMSFSQKTGRTRENPSMRVGRGIAGRDS